METGSEALLTSALQLDDGTIVVAGLAGTVLVSSDGGRTFALHQQADRKGMTAVLQTAGDDLVMLGESGIKRLPAATLIGGAQ